jgi:predicted phage terminase large subunit-like protein
MYDNPYLDHETYSENLDELDSVSRAQLKRGDWMANREGRWIKREDFEIVQELPVNARRVRYWDLAATDAKEVGTEPSWTVGIRMSRTPEGLIFIEDMVEMQANPGRVELVVRQTADLDTIAVMVRMEQEPGSAGKNNIHNYRTRVLSPFNFKGDRPSGAKEVRIRPFIGQVEAGNVYLLAGKWNERYLTMMEELPEKGWDHADATSGAYSYLAGGRPRARVRIT